MWMKKLYMLVVFCGLAQVTMSCSEEDAYDSTIVKEYNNEDEDKDKESESPTGEQPADSPKSFAGVYLYASNSKGNQSSAAYGDYLVLVPKSRGYLHLYNLRTKKPVCSLKLTANTEFDYKGVDLYHCNQTTFGVDFYEPSDPFPLMYISQRAREDRRCFLEVYRLVPNREEGEDDYSSLDAKLVQTIFFPAMSFDNSLGNVNCAIDSQEHLVYTYSRNNTKGDDNYRECKISCFEIPRCDKDTVFLEDKDIKMSYMLGCSALNMQGGCILNGKLYIGQGYKSAGYIYLNVVDLKKKSLQRIDLLDNGVTWEPEGCFTYNGNIMISTGKNIWEFHFD